MKILITNPDALIDADTGKLFEGIEEVLDKFNEVDGQQTFVISVDAAKLRNIPESMKPVHVPGTFRGGRGLIDRLQTIFKINISDILVLGCKQIDVGLAANSKLLLLRADYAEKQNSGELIYRNHYGIAIKDVTALQLFLDKFLPIKKPWFYKCDVSAKTVIYSLTNANTNQYRDSDIVKISTKFQNHLKNGDDSFKEEFLVYFLVSTYAIVKEFKKVDYWGIYPSSSTATNEDLQYYKEKARQSYECRTPHPVFIRQKATSKRHMKSTERRLEIGADEELETIRINDYYQNKLKGATVCIIDDFTNVGSSCETARALLEKAGVAKLIFITLGKFGKIYKAFEYTVHGDPYGEFTYERGEDKMLTGEFNNASDLQFIASLGEIVK